MIALILLLQADLDIQSAFTRYEEYQSGRGQVFIRQLDAALALLRVHPDIAPVYAGPYRRMLIRDFPYGIFYQAQANRIVVAAVIDLRQDPKILRRKLLGPEA
jgi:plasmid stabilization system protein ParE